MGPTFFPFRVTLFQNGLGVQESKRSVIKIVSLVKNGYPFNLNEMLRFLLYLGMQLLLLLDRQDYTEAAQRWILYDLGSSAAISGTGKNLNIEDLGEFTYKHIYETTNVKCSYYSNETHLILGNKFCSVKVESFPEGLGMQVSKQEVLKCVQLAKDSGNQQDVSMHLWPHSTAVPKWNLRNDMKNRAVTCKNIASDMRTQRRLISACASTQSYQSLRCPHEDILQPWLSKMHPMRWLIWIFAGRTYPNLHFLTLRPNVAPRL